MASWSAGVLALEIIWSRLSAVTACCWAAARATDSVVPASRTRHAARKIDSRFIFPPRLVVGPAASFARALRIINFTNLSVDADLYLSPPLPYSSELAVVDRF